MDAIRDASKAQATAVRAALPKRVAVIGDMLTATFGKSVGEMRAAFAASLDTAEGSVNAEVAELILKTQDELLVSMDDLAAIARWINLSVPECEDGNNFGVEVQGHVLKVVTEKSAKLKTALDGLKEYHTQRAGAMDKLVSAVSKKTSSSTSESVATGGKEEDAGPKTSKSSSKEESATETRAVADHHAYAVALDVHWWFHVKSVIVTMMDVLAVVGDTVEKNKSKVQDPKGGRGGGGMGMY